MAKLSTSTTHVLLRKVQPQLQSLILPAQHWHSASYVDLHPDEESDSGVRFDERSWRNHLAALKPIGLAAMANASKPVTSSTGRLHPRDRRQVAKGTPATSKTSVNSRTSRGSANQSLGGNRDDADHGDGRRGEGGGASFAGAGAAESGGAARKGSGSGTSPLLLPDAGLAASGGSGQLTPEPKMREPRRSASISAAPGVTARGAGLVASLRAGSGPGASLLGATDSPGSALAASQAGLVQPQPLRSSGRLGGAQRRFTVGALPKVPATAVTRAPSRSGDAASGAGLGESHGSDVSGDSAAKSFTLKIARTLHLLRPRTVMHAVSEEIARACVCVWAHICCCCACFVINSHPLYLWSPLTRPLAWTVALPACGVPLTSSMAGATTAPAAVAKTRWQAWCRETMTAL